MRGIPSIIGKRLPAASTSVPSVARSGSPVAGLIRLTTADDWPYANTREEEYGSAGSLHHVRRAYRSARPVSDPPISHRLVRTWAPDHHPQLRETGADG